MTRNNKQKKEIEPQQSDDDLLSLCESQKDYISHDDFSNKTRGGVPFGGLTPTELTEEALKKINTRWEQFYRKKKDIIDHIADYVSINWYALCSWHSCQIPSLSG